GVHAAPLLLHLLDLALELLHQVAEVAAEPAAGARAEPLAQLAHRALHLLAPVVAGDAAARPPTPRLTAVRGRRAVLERLLRLRAREALEDLLRAEADRGVLALDGLLERGPRLLAEVDQRLGRGLAHAEVRGGEVLDEAVELLRVVDALLRVTGRRRGC